MAIAVSSPRTGPSGAGGRRAIRGPRPRFPLLPGTGAGLSRNTLNAYRTDLLQYGAFLAKHEAGALTARPAHVAEFLAELATGNGRPPCSASTIHRKAACLRSFYKHLRREELIADDPTAALSAPRRAKKLPRSSTTPRSRGSWRRRGGASPPSSATAPCSR